MTHDTTRAMMQPEQMGAAGWLARVMAVTTAAALAAACGGGGGGGKGAVEPEEPEAVETGDDAAGDPEQHMVSGRKLDEIRAFFDRKSRIVARCYGDAIEAGDKLGGRVTVLMNMQIAPSGALRNLEFVPSAPSETLTTCLREHAERWTLAPLDQPLDYSYTFAFEGL